MNLVCIYLSLIKYLRKFKRVILTNEDMEKEIEKNKIGNDSGDSSYEEEEDNYIEEYDIPEIINDVIFDYFEF